MASEDKTAPTKEDPQPAQQSSLTVRTGGSRTRSTSPSVLTAEMIGRLRRQMERMDALHDLEDGLTSTEETVKPLEVEAFRQQIEQVHGDFANNHDWLLNNMTPALVDHSYFATNVLRSEERLVLKLRRILLRIQQTPSSSQGTVAPMAAQSVGHRSRLPELTVPRFNSSYTMWPHFRAMFRSLIIEREDLTDLERFQYLSGALSGEAAVIVAAFPPQADSFAGAWKALGDRFEKKRLIIVSQFKKIMHLRQIKPKDGKALREIVNLLNETVQTMKFCGATDFTEPFMTTFISELLDADTRDRLEEQLDDNEMPQLSHLISFLDTRARRLEPSSPSHPAAGPTPPETSKGSTKAKQTTTHVAKAAAQQTISRDSKANEYPCDCCKGNHFIVSCPKFRAFSLEQRIDQVKIACLCTNCLGRHNLRNCRSKVLCRVCDEPHHTMLHGADFSQIIGPKAQSYSQVCQRSDQPPGPSRPGPSNLPKPSQPKKGSQ